MNYRTVDSTVAKKYAKAFLSVFPHSFVFSDLTKIEIAQNFLQTHKRTLFFLQLPQFTPKIRLSMVEDLIGYFSLPIQFSEIFLLLIDHNRSFFIPDVLYFIMMLYKERIGILDFSIMSAHELDEKKRIIVKRFLERITGKNSMCTYGIDKSLIAGMRLQSVEYKWEYSVRKQIESLRMLEKEGV